MVIGLTGSIGAGKTEVAQILAFEYDFRHINADMIASKVLNEQQAQVLSLFPDCFDDGKLQRGRLSSLIFNDDHAREKLTRLLHPFIEREINSMIESDPDSHWVLDVPLLIEANFHSRCDSVLVVVASDQLRMQRVFDRSRISEDDFKKRDSIQLSQAEKMTYADWVIHNNDDIESLHEQVAAFIQFLERSI